MASTLDLAHTRIGILADDLTGSVDSSLAFWEHAIPSTILLDQRAMPVLSSGEISALALDTNSRHDVGEVARECVLAATKMLQMMGATLLYKKIDSTLRGNIGIEIEAMLEASGARQAIVCPAFPATGRAVVQGRVVVNGVDLLETAIARDPRSVVVSSRIASVLAAQTHLPIAELSSPSSIAEARDAAIVVVDAETYDHLRSWVSAFGLGRDTLWVGSAGLAGAIAAALQVRGGAQPGMQTSQRVLPGRAVLVVAGSAHPTTREQVDALGDKCIKISPAHIQAGTFTSEQTANQIINAFMHEGWAALAVDSLPVSSSLQTDRSNEAQPDPHKGGHYMFEQGELEDVVTPLVGVRSPNKFLENPKRSIDYALGEVVATVVGGLPAAPHLVLTGGDTARAVLQRLDIAHLQIIGAVAPGIPIAETPDGAIKVITKAGGFGTSDVLVRAVRILQE